MIRLTPPDPFGLYSGPITLADALIHSDNSVFAQVGLQVGTRKVARIRRTG